MTEPSAPAGCQSCQAPTGDEGQLCRTHTGALRADLAAVPDLVTDLEITITRQDKLARFNDRKSSGETPLNWNENAAQVRWELEATLNAWALDVSKLWQDERDLLADIHHTQVAELALWLRRNSDTARQHQHAGQALDEIGEAVRRAIRAVDHPNVRSRFLVGPCPEQINDEPCDGQVWTFISSTEDELSFMRCLACESKWDSSQWLRVGPRIELRRRRRAV